MVDNPACGFAAAEEIIVFLVFFDIYPHLFGYVFFEGCGSLFVVALVGCRATPTVIVIDYKLVEMLECGAFEEQIKVHRPVGNDGERFVVGVAVEKRTAVEGGLVADVVVGEEEEPQLVGVNYGVEIVLSVVVIVWVFVPINLHHITIIDVRLAVDLFKGFF